VTQLGRSEGTELLGQDGALTRYLTSAPDQKRMRLLGFQRVEIALGKSAGDLVLTGSANLTGRLFGN
jgi:hypothetical protein